MFKSLFRPPDSIRALGLACLLGAVWPPIMSAATNDGHFGQAVVEGIVFGPIVVLALEVLGRPITYFLLRSGEFWWVLAIPFVVVRVVLSLPPVIVANALLARDWSTPPDTSVGCPYAGTVKATLDVDFSGRSVRRGEELFHVANDGRVLVGGSEWGWVTDAGDVIEGDARSGSAPLAHFSGSDVVREGRAIGRVA